MTTFFLQNFGCRVNQAEAFGWSDELQRGGLRPESDVRRSEIVVVNTCTLTAKADRDVKRFLRRVARENPAARLVVAGCMVDRAGGELEGFPGVWRFVRNEGKPGLVPLLIGSQPRPAAEEGTVLQPFRSRGMVKVQDGCDFRCAFCVIPAVRGPSRSLAPDAVLAGLRRLAERGSREAVLTGIHLSSYGLDLEPRTGLARLIDLAGRSIPALQLRLSSLDPRFLDETLVKTLARSPHVCPHFHLSLQHGSERVLELMGRRGGEGEYSRWLEELHRLSPEAALGADMIVGFPGETDADFGRSLDFVERSPLAYLHVFPYSARPGTPAASRPQVDPAVKKRRTSELRLLSSRKSREFRMKFLGRVLEGLVVKRSGGKLHLLTPNYLSLSVPLTGPAPSGKARVRVTEVEDGGLRGELEASP